MADERPHRGWYQPRGLPHFDSPERVQFVTFRLADSLPSSFANQDESSSQVRRRLEQELDEGLGVCWMAEPEVATVVENAIRTFDAERYRLWAWCVMPNHVHCLFEPFDGHRLADIVRSWKINSALHANRLLKREGAFWQKDYFDRFMRNEAQLANTIDYIERNPVQAGLCTAPNEWRWSSAWGRS